MTWIKPVIVAEPKTELEMVSIYDPELDLECTPKEPIESYMKGKLEAHNEFIWKGEKTLFVCRPLRKEDWFEMQIQTRSKMASLDLDESGQKIYFSQQLSLMVFNKCFKCIKSGDATLKRIECFDNIPLNVRQELGNLVFVASNAIDPF